MDRKSKRRKNKAERYGSNKNAPRETQTKEEERLDNVQDHRGNKESREPSPPALSGTNSKNSNSKENISKQTPTNSKEEPVEKHSPFKKREVLNNWERYDEIQPERGMEEMKGTDFTLLLESSGGSYFRFRDEQEWESSVEAKNEMTEFLSFNSEELAKAISCIPLPSRLMIREEIFPTKLLNKFNKSAKENLRRYKDSNSVAEKLNLNIIEKLTNPSEPVAQSYVINDGITESDDENFDEDEEEIVNVTNQKDQNICDTKPSNNETVTEVKDKNENNLISSTNEVKPVSNALPAGSVKVDNDDENELDYLLSLNAPAKMPVVCSEKEKPVDNSEDSKKVDKKDIQLFPESKGTESLEDWLDDFLDDD